MKKYSFLIPTKNNIHFTERCLLSIIKDLDKELIDYSAVEILFLDAHSTDGLPELVEHYRGLDIRIIQFDDDNFSKKNNEGARQANGSYLILLNNDTEVLEDLILPMEKGLNQPGVGIVSNKHFFPDMALNHVGIAFKADRTPVHIYPGESDKYPFLNISRVVPAVTAACVMVKKSEFLKIGGFDENYVYGYEDVDLCLKYKKELGKSSYVATDSRIIHFGQSSYGRDRGEENNRKYFLEKWKDEKLTLFEDIYRKDGFFKIKSREKLLKKAQKGFHKLKRIVRPAKIQVEDSKQDKPNLDENTIVFFYDDIFNSFNVVIKNLYESYLKNFSGELKVLHDSPSNFEKYLDEPCMTVTWTHFWDQYYVRTRKYADRDFRLYAINYENLNTNYSDYWTSHIKVSKFQILSISTYCTDFLVKAGVDNARIHLLNLGYWNEFAKTKPNPELHEPPVYMVMTNTNDPERYGTTVAIQALSEAFKDKKDKVKLLIRDYGSNPAYVHNLASLYLDGFTAEVSHGFLDNDALAELYLRGDVLVNPFRGEGFGMKILEAGIQGLVVIAPNYGGPKDFLKDMEALEVEYKLSPIGKTIDKDLLLLNDNYVDCDVQLSSLVEKINYSFGSLSELKKKAAEKSDNLKGLYSWGNVSKNLSQILAPFQKPLETNSFNEYAILPSIIINEIENPKVSLLINTYNRPDLIENTLNHISKLNDIKEYTTEVVVINDGSDSKEEYRKAIKKFENITDFSIRYIEYEKNRGNSFSKNVGLYNSKGWMSVFLGDDIIPMNGFISRRIKQHEDIPKILLLGHTEWDSTIRNNLIAEFAVKYSSFQFAYEVYRNHKEIFSVNLYTSNISFLTEEIRGIGMYLEDIEGITLYEDTLWGLDLGEKGFRLIYDRKIQAMHKHNVDFKWLKERSKIIGATTAKIFLLYPDSVKFTSAREYITLLRKNTDLFISKEKNRLWDSIIEKTEENYAKDYEVLESLIKSTSDLKARMSLMTCLHERLHQIYIFYSLYGFLKEMGLLESYSALLLMNYYNFLQTLPIVSTTVDIGLKAQVINKIKQKIRDRIKRIIYRN
jgi:GT2 family glycosyltransferase